MDMEAEAFKALAEKYQARIEELEKDREWKRNHYSNLGEWVDILESALLDMGKPVAANAVKKQLDNFPLRFDEDATKDDPDMVKIKTALMEWAEASFGIK